MLAFSLSLCKNLHKFNQQLNICQGSNAKPCNYTIFHNLEYIHGIKQIQLMSPISNVLQCCTGWHVGFSVRLLSVAYLQLLISPAS